MRFISLVLTVIVVGAVVVVGLSFVGNPTPSCADGTIAVSKAAEDSFNSKWNGFEAAVKRGEAATATFTEEELTSRGARYLTDMNLPAKNLQVHLCAGQSKGQAAAKIEVLGMVRDIVVTGHLQSETGGSRIVLDGIQVGLVPEAVGATLANTALGIANIRASIEIPEVTTTSTTATLKGKK